MPPGAGGGNEVLVVRVTECLTAAARIYQYTVPEDGLPVPPDYRGLGPPLRASTADGERGKPTLDMVVIPRGDTEGIGVSKSNFIRLYNAYNVDPYLLSYISENWYGFHQPSSPYNGAYAFFVGTVLYTLVFSFNPETMKSSAILLPRASNGFGTGPRATKELIDILQQYLDQAHSPVTLLLAVRIHLEQWLDRTLYVQLNAIRAAETISGYGPYGGSPRRVNIDSLVSMSSQVGSLQVTLANTARHQAIAASLDTYLGSCLGLTRPTYGVTDPEHWRKSHAGFDEVLNALQQQLAGGITTTKYLQERTQSQSDVAFALMTHEDAVISIDQNSSMKAIAIVTMAFLPGTFFATLFAVPSLQWSQSPVIQGNFWVYWVFTLPFTVLVLLLWYGLTSDWRRDLLLLVKEGVISKLRVTRRTRRNM